jgi:predicted transcriptional regulator
LNKKEDYHQELYHEITVGLAPQGMVVVWVVGRNVVEIGRFQAQEVSKKEADQISMQHYKGVGGENPMPMDKTINEKELIAEGIDRNVIDLALQGKITCKQWDDYRLRYNWKFEFNQELELYNFYLRYYNSEKEGYIPTTSNRKEYNKILLESSSKVVPSKLGAYVTAKNGKNYLFRIHADEQEIIEAFKTLEALSPKQTISIYIAVDPDFKKFTITLKNDKKAILLEKCTLKLFTLTKENDRKNEEGN